MMNLNKRFQKGLENKNNQNKRLKLNLNQKSYHNNNI